MSKLAIILGTAFVLFSAALPGRAAESGDAVVVVFNKNVPESRDVAEYYAKRRRVPDSQVIGLDLPTTETISRADFQKFLQKPLFGYLVVRGIFKVGQLEFPADGSGTRQRVLESRIRYAVLCYGVPLRILQDDTLVEPGAEKLRPEIRKNGAAVDSELALLPQARQNIPLAGFFKNPFYGAIGADLRFLHPTNGILMVARLDGPTPAIARGLVDKALDAEWHGLWGRAYFDARGLTEGAYVHGDQWIRGGAEWARRMGFETVLDTNSATFAESFPMSQIALYAGWYTGDANGPFARPTVEFMPGAFAYHLHSFSAATLRSTTKNWVGPLLAKGATVTLGHVDEPYLDATSDVAMLLQNFLHNGASFGEAAYSAEHCLSWQTTIVGDPLYRPFGVPVDLLHYRLEISYSRLIEWSHLLVVNRNLVVGAPVDEVVNYLQNQPFIPYSAVLTEKLADLLRAKSRLPDAIAAYQQALQRHPSPLQTVRLLLTLADLQTTAALDKDAADTYQQFLKECPDYPAPLGIYQKLLPLATRLKNTDLVAKCDAEIKRLAPVPAPPSTNSSASTNH